MTDSDDGAHDDNDDRLRSLRAVWLSLPDEEPPERGLAELMAAARAKAEEMATPPWWQRIAQLLRRPPVLALASVMVLIGGAVLIGKRGDEMQAEPPATRTQDIAPAPPTAPGAATPPSEMAPAGGEAEDRGVLQAAPAAEPPEAAEEQRKVERPSERRPAPRATRPATTTTTPPPETARDHAPAPTEATTGLLRADDDKATASTDAEMRELASPRASSATSAPAAPSAPSVSQLHADARAAAARGDCDAARMLAARIEKRDATYHKAKVAPDPALAACLRR